MKCEKSGNHTISYQSLLLSTTVLMICDSICKNRPYCHNNYPDSRYIDNVARWLASSAFTGNFLLTLSSLWGHWVLIRWHEVSKCSQCPPQLVMWCRPSVTVSINYVLNKQLGYLCLLEAITHSPVTLCDMSGSVDLKNASYKLWCKSSMAATKQNYSVLNITIAKCYSNNSVGFCKSSHVHIRKFIMFIAANTRQPVTDSVFNDIPVTY